MLHVYVREYTCIAIRTRVQELQNSRTYSPLPGFGFGLPVRQKPGRTHACCLRVLVHSSTNSSVRSFVGTPWLILSGTGTTMVPPATWPVWFMFTCRVMWPASACVLQRSTAATGYLHGCPKIPSDARSAFPRSRIEKHVGGMLLEPAGMLLLVHTPLKQNNGARKGTLSAVPSS